MVQQIKVIGSSVLSEQQQSYLVDRPFVNPSVTTQTRPFIPLLTWVTLANGHFAGTRPSSQQCLQ